MKPANIELHIEELVLHGFAPGDRYRIGDAVTRELQRLLVEQNIPHLLTEDMELPQIDAGTFALAANAKSETIGTQIAQSIYEGMRGGPNR